MQSIARIAPLPVMIFILAALSIIGIPISIGFLTVAHLYSVIPINMMGYIAIGSLSLSSILSCCYFGKAIFQMLSPGDNDAVIYHQSKGLSLITTIGFIVLSIALAFYLQDITNYLCNMSKI